MNDYYNISIILQYNYHDSMKQAHNLPVDNVIPQAF